MKIIVRDETVIDVFQQQFHEQFPFLKVEFFQSKGEHYRVPVNKTFGAYRTNSEHITIAPSMTVAELEKECRAHYGLSPLIFRQSGKAWLETSLTDHWTLQEQNEQGKALSS